MLTHLFGADGLVSSVTVEESPDNVHWLPLSPYWPFEVSALSSGIRRVFTIIGPSETAKNSSIKKERKAENDFGKNKERTGEETKGKAEKAITMRRSMSFSILRAPQCFFYIGLMTTAASASFSCVANQAAELGKQGIIVCSFPETFHAVHWFDHASTRSAPLASYTYQTGTKRDFCLENESYDVSDNGSLLICNVSLWHEKNYTAVMYRNLDLFEKLTVSLTVVAYPGNLSPIVQCCNCYGERYLRIPRSESLSCSFTAARPPVQLKWIERFPINDSLALTQEVTITNNSNGTYDSLAKLRLPQRHGKLILIFSCRAFYHFFSSEWERESEIFVDISQMESYASVPSTTNYMEINRRAEVQCGDSEHMVLIWKIISSTGESETIGFRFYNLTRMTKTITGLTMSSEGSLVFSSAQFRHEGEYACVYKDGEQDKIGRISVILLVTPSPPYLKISGCDDSENTCVLDEDITPEFTCTIDKVYPMATLEWISNTPPFISFYQNETVRKKFGKLHSVSFSVKYSLSDIVMCGEKISVDCRVQGPISQIMKAQRTVTLNYNSAHCTMIQDSREYLHSPWSPVTFCMVLLVCLLNFIILKSLRSVKDDRKRAPLQLLTTLTLLTLLSYKLKEINERKLKWTQASKSIQEQV